MSHDFVKFLKHLLHRIQWYTMYESIKGEEWVV